MVRNGVTFARHLRPVSWEPLTAAPPGRISPRSCGGRVPTILVIVDAVDMGLPAGAVRIVPPDRIEDCGIGTHTLPLTALISFIGDDAGAVIVVGIQPATLDSKEELSPAVREGANALAALIRQGRVWEIPVLEE